MAHLIKLEDYISRYQFDLHRYPSQYSRMKKERWYYLKSEWEQLQYELVQIDSELEVVEEQGLFSRTLQRMAWWKENATDKIESSEQQSIVDKKPTERTLEELRKSFLDDLFHSQLRWASSSLMEESALHPRYKMDKWLRFFTQQLPDNYFLMYNPVFYIKKARIELDLILISPTEVICITLVEGHEHSIFEANSDRFWTEYIDKQKKKKISPLPSMFRMTSVIGGILTQAGYSFPIQKIVVSPTSMIDNKILGSNVQFVDRRTFDSWHHQLKRHPSPLKHEQMKVTSLLLDYCYTVSNEHEGTFPDNSNHSKI